MKKKEVKKAFKSSIEQLMNVGAPPFDEHLHLFDAHMSASKALRIILLKYLLNILYYKEKLIDTHTDEELHQFRVNLRRSRAFIKTFSSLLKNDLDKLLLKQLSTLASSTNKKRDLDVIQEELHEHFKHEADIYNTIQQQIASQKEYISTILKDASLESFLLYYQEVLTKSKHLYIAHSEDKNIKKYAKTRINALDANIKKKIRILKKEFSVKKLHKIRIAFKKLRYLLEEFDHLFKERPMHHAITHVKTLQDILGEFNDTVNQKALIKNYMEEMQPTLAHDNLLEHTSKKQDQLIDETLRALNEYLKLPTMIS